MTDDALIEAMARAMCEDYWGDQMEWEKFIYPATAALAAIRKTHAVVPNGEVMLPSNADEAKAMWLIGEAWVRANAPHMLKASEDSAHG